MQDKRSSPRIVLVSFCLALTGVFPRVGAGESVNDITTQSGVQMAVLPGGTFTMGQKDGEVDESPHAVTLSPFAIDKFEVTQQEYEQVMGNNPSKVKGPKNPPYVMVYFDCLNPTVKCNLLLASVN